MVQKRVRKEIGAFSTDGEMWYIEGCTLEKSALVGGGTGKFWDKTCRGRKLWKNINQSVEKKNT